MAQWTVDGRRQFLNLDLNLHPDPIDFLPCSAPSSCCSSTFLLSCSCVSCVPTSELRCSFPRVENLQSSTSLVNSFPKFSASSHISHLTSPHFDFFLSSSILEATAKSSVSIRACITWASIQRPTSSFKDVRHFHTLRFAGSSPAFACSSPPQRARPKTNTERPKRT